MEFVLFSVFFFLVLPHWHPNSHDHNNLTAREERCFLRSTCRDVISCHKCFDTQVLTSFGKNENPDQPWTIS
jgi:hypothetical protein